MLGVSLLIDTIPPSQSLTPFSYSVEGMPETLLVRVDEEGQCCPDFKRLQIYGHRTLNVPQPIISEAKQDGAWLVLPGRVVHSFNPSTWEAEAGGLLRVEGQPKIYNKFKTNVEYIAKSYLKGKGEEGGQGGKNSSRTEMA